MSTTASLSITTAERRSRQAARLISHSDNSKKEFFPSEIGTIWEKRSLGEKKEKTRVRDHEKKEGRQRRL